MQEAKRLVINIVTWNSLAYMPNLFASLATQDTDAFTVTVVDNASTDGAIRWLAERAPEVTVLRNFRNQGFSRAHNQAIALALSRWPEETWTRRYILVCNPDIEFDPSCVRRLMDAMESDTALAACGPKLLRTRVRSQEEGQLETERTNLLDATGLVVTRSRRVVDRGAGEEDRGQYDRLTDVFGFSGACALFRASALVAAKIGGEFFDEDFFLYQEDVDLAWRMRRLGMRVRFVPDARAWHHRRAPSLPSGGILTAWNLRKKKSPFINYLSTRNHLWLLMKNEELPNLLFHAHRIIPYEIAKGFASFVSWAVLKGNCAALLGIRRMWYKRRACAPEVRVSGRDMRRWFV